MIYPTSNKEPNSDHINDISYVQRRTQLFSKLLMKFEIVFANSWSLCFERILPKSAFEISGQNSPQETPKICVVVGWF